MATAVTESSDVLAKLDIIYQELVKSTFYYVSRALYKQDRLTFALRFVKAELFDDKEWNFFCGNLVDEAVLDSASAPSWLSEEVQLQVARLRKVLLISTGECKHRNDVTCYA
uniref:14_3_3 domain-containing protein n=1 Tax=Bursaphelenchus xylophilus TaxID=6326 RepID=A0A1I7S0U6_BURXY